jgi:hypothetical protein
VTIIEFGRPEAPAPHGGQLSAAVDMAVAANLRRAVRYARGLSNPWTLSRRRRNIEASIGHSCARGSAVSVLDPRGLGQFRKCEKGDGPHRAEGHRHKCNCWPWRVSDHDRRSSKVALLPHLVGRRSRSGYVRVPDFTSSQALGSVRDPDCPPVHPTNTTNRHRAEEHARLEPRLKVHLDRASVSACCTGNDAGRGSIYDAPPVALR